MEFPGAAAGVELGIENHAQVPALAPILDRRQHLDPAFEIAFHAICRADEIFFRTTVAEIVNAPMLQEAADDTDDADVVGQSRYARTQSAGIAHDHLDFHARL